MMHSFSSPCAPHQAVGAGGWHPDAGHVAEPAGGTVIVEVVGGADELPEVRVADVEDLTRLHLAVGALTDEDVDSALRRAGLGRLVDADTGVLDVAALRAAAREQATAADWDAQFDEM